MTDGRTKRPRGQAIPLPSWWLLEFQQKATGFGDEQLLRIANAIDTTRPQLWERTTVGKFRRGVSPTLELVRIFSKAFDIPEPVIIATTKAEALELLGVVKAHERIRIMQAHAKKPEERSESESVTRMGEVFAGAFDERELAQMREEAEQAGKKRALAAAKARKRRQLGTK